MMEILLQLQPDYLTMMPRFSVRLSGIDSPEIRTHNPDEKISAIMSRDKLHDLIFDKIVTLRNVSLEKYRRILADVYLDELHINQWLLDNHYAIKYNGGKNTSLEHYNCFPRMYFIAVSYTHLTLPTKRIV